MSKGTKREEVSDSKGRGAGGKVKSLMSKKPSVRVAGIVLKHVFAVEINVARFAWFVSPGWLMPGRKPVSYITDHAPRPKAAPHCTTGSPWPGPRWSATCSTRAPDGEC